MRGRFSGIVIAQLMRESKGARGTSRSVGLNAKERKMNMYFIAIPLVVLLFLSGIRIVRPTSRGLVERLGKYRRFAMPGFNWIIP
jgi:regulator of protease activity HflC (stomatin/prohibitin superfamily)